ncbi:MAG: hypothetical protein MUC65_07570 [Pontiellaceae bacterium]|nr:hypothetical protein [Pontiellaceae bacterium]
MNPEAYHAVRKTDNKVVFIITTAGDAGQRDGGGNPDTPYYKAREEGSLRAVRFMVNTGNGNRGPQGAPETVTVNGHNLERYVYANCVTIFLRLPDGNPGGTGYQSTNHESLQNFYSNACDQITTVNNSTTYKDWNDLVSTLAGIVRYETTESAIIIFHTAETDETINPGDHSDHRHTTFAVKDAAKEFPDSLMFLYCGYSTGNRESNITSEDLQINIGTWAATASGLSDNGYHSTWEPGHNCWLSRSYSRPVEK